MLRKSIREYEKIGGFIVTKRLRPESFPLMSLVALGEFETANATGH
jgi:hypothetical protein